MITEIITILWHIALCMVGLVMVVSGIWNLNKTDHFAYIVEIPTGVFSIIVGLVLLYFGGAFSIIWELYTYGRISLCTLGVCH